MEIPTLKTRLQSAALVYSLRALSQMCGVSHETIRQVLNGSPEPNLTSKSLQKIDSGLTKNGF